MKRVNYFFFIIPLLLLSLQSKCQSGTGISSVDTLISYRTLCNVRLNIGEIKLARKQGLEAMIGNKRAVTQWITGTSISYSGFAVAGIGVGLTYVALKYDNNTEWYNPSELVVYRVRNQVALAAGLLSFVIGASLVQVGVDRKVKSIRTFNATQRTTNRENVTLNFGLVGGDKIGFTIKLP